MALAAPLVPREFLRLEAVEISRLIQLELPREPFSELVAQPAPLVPRAFLRLEAVVSSHPILLELPRETLSEELLAPAAPLVPRWSSCLPPASANSPLSGHRRSLSKVWSSIHPSTHQLSLGSFAWPAHHYLRTTSLWPAPRLTCLILSQSTESVSPPVSGPRRLEHLLSFAAVFLKLCPTYPMMSPQGGFVLPVLGDLLCSAEHCLPLLSQAPHPMCLMVTLQGASSSPPV
mmetsp:Transcript_31341/g.50326  ORF Transcript_31341/g.50326 Transcript_31341/m.50326 type:complete len:232 (-) Transcript_31341:1420-2115(-)